MHKKSLEITTTFNTEKLCFRIFSVSVTVKISLIIKFRQSHKAATIENETDIEPSDTCRKK